MMGLNFSMEDDLFTYTAFPSSTLNAGGHVMIQQAQDEDRKINHWMALQTNDYTTRRFLYIFPQSYARN